MFGRSKGFRISADKAREGNSLGLAASHGEERFAGWKAPS